MFISLIYLPLIYVRVIYKIFFRKKFYLDHHIILSRADICSIFFICDVLLILNTAYLLNYADNGTHIAVLDNTTGLHEVGENRMIWFLLKIIVGENRMIWFLL